MSALSVLWHSDSQPNQIRIHCVAFFPVYKYRWWLKAAVIFVRVSKFPPMITLKVSSLCHYFKTQKTDFSLCWLVVVACLGWPEARTISCESWGLDQAGTWAPCHGENWNNFPGFPQPSCSVWIIFKMANLNIAIECNRLCQTWTLVTREDGTEMNSEFLFHSGRRPGEIAGHRGWRDGLNWYQKIN